MNIRILHATVSGIPLVSGLRTGMRDPCVCEVFGAPVFGGQAYLQPTIYLKCALRQNVCSLSSIVVTKAG